MYQRPVLVLVVLLLSPFVQAAPVKNGFDLAGSLVPAAEILPGGPPRDGIPAIDQPRFVPAHRAHWLDPEDRVLGLTRNGEAKAYPIAILNWHEIVNDRFGQEPVAITYCPLCGTGVAFEARVAGRQRDFGVSGLLYNSDVLLYDRQSESLWSQIARQAVSGPLKGAKLTPIPLDHTSWGDWRARHPDTRVLSRETGFHRDYDRNPYGDYAASETVFFPLSSTSRRYHPKEQVIGLELDGQAKAWPFVELAKAGTPVRDRLAGRELTIRFDPEHRTGRVLDKQGQELPAIIAYWFAWHAFHPQGEVFTAP